MDIPWMLGQWAEKQPEKICLIWRPFTGEQQSWTYRELFDAARRLAAGLKNRGVNTGDFVFIHMDNSPEFIISWYGCAMLGAVAVSTNTRDRLSKMGYTVETVEDTYRPTTAIWFDREHGTMQGGASNTGDDYGVAW